MACPAPLAMGGCRKFTRTACQVVSSIVSLFRTLIRVDAQVLFRTVSAMRALYLERTCAARQIRPLFHTVSAYREPMQNPSFALKREATHQGAMANRFTSC